MVEGHADHPGGGEGPISVISLWGVGIATLRKITAIAGVSPACCNTRAWGWLAAQDEGGGRGKAVSAEGALALDHDHLGLLGSVGQQRTAASTSPEQNWDGNGIEAAAQ